MTEANEAGDRIMIVDDDIDNLNVLLDFLDKAGFHTMVAKDGATAIELAGHTQPDLILLDVMMPGQDGFETCRILKEKTGVRDVPVIFITALSETVNKVKGFEAGGVDYITKPFENEELLARVNAHLTIRKLQNLLLGKNLELQEINNSKDKFFSILAHDLRNPMSVFLSFSKLLNKIDSMNKKELKLYIKQFEESASNLFALLDNLLTWSRIQRKVIEFSPKILKLATIANWNIKVLELNAWQKKIIIKNLVGENICAYADDNMINTVIRNLLTNALKYSNSGNTVEIKAENDGKFVRVSVMDSGIGIPDNVLPNLFRIDSRYREPGTSGEKGTGLGLILCREFIERNGGNIWVESKPGEGTKVSFTIPAPS